MTPKQVLEGVRDFLKGIQYTGTSTEIFNETVYVPPDVPILQLSRFRSPAAIIKETGQRHDPEWPGLILLGFVIFIYVENVQNPYGDSAILGGAGEKGLKDIEKEIILQLPKQTDFSSNKITISSKNANAPTMARSNELNLLKAMNFEAFCSVY